MRITVNECEEFNLAPVSQFCGMNVLKKRELLDVILTYFGASDACAGIKIDGETVGREYFVIHHIMDKRDLLSEISVSKNSMMYKNILNYINQFDAEKIMEQIDNSYALLFQKINEKLSEEIGDVTVDYDLIKKNEEIIKKCEVSSPQNNLELLLLYINLIKGINKNDPRKRLVIIENIDFMISRQEFVKALDYSINVVKEHDIWFLFTISLPGFDILRTELIEGMTVVNDVIYSFDEVLRIKQYLEENYPFYKEFSDTEILEVVQRCMHSVGSVHENSVRSIIVDRILSKSMGVNKECAKEEIKLAEIAFLNEKI